MATRGARLDADERARLAALANAETLDDLVEITGAGDERAAYFRAKTLWRDLRERTLDPPDRLGGIPGRRVTVGGHGFHVHGVTHADTPAERSFLRGRVERLVEDGAVVYCEQGLRRLYFEGLGVCEMDDHAWASRVWDARSDGGEPASPLAALPDRLDGGLDRVRTAVFGLIDGGSDVYGERFRDALGDVASGLLTDHTDLATGEGFEAFAMHRRAAADPDALAALQHYYEVVFLPQPVERAWLARHDPRLEILTHGRNARMADYAVYHNETARRVHLVVGAAHQPGVVHYLERIRDGERTVEDFRLAG